MRGAPSYAPDRIGDLDERLIERRRKIRKARAALGRRTIMVGADYLFAMLLAGALYLLIHMIDSSVHWTGGHSWRH